MCGRYSLYLPIDKIALELGFEVADLLLEPRYNAAPSQRLPVLTNSQPQEIQLFRWGLIPFWAKDPRIGYKMINARSETALEKNSFKRPMQKRRCLVLADGFYEWKPTPTGKQPYRISYADGRLITMGGLWEVWKDAEEKEIRSFTILTTDANEVVQPLHDRMPVFIGEEARSRWLNPDLPGEEVVDLLKPAVPEGMVTAKVSKKLGSPANDGPSVLVPEQDLFS